MCGDDGVDDGEEPVHAGMRVRLLIEPILELAFEAVEEALIAYVGSRGRHDVVPRRLDLKLDLT